MKEAPKDEITLTTPVDVKMLDHILGLINKLDDKINLAKNAAKTLLVCGDTGAGKSTLINYLIGRKMIATKKPLTKVYLLETAGDTDIKIGHTVTSETFIPKSITDPEHGISYWDCPGFDDSRGAAVDIANAFGINKLLSNSKNIKILLVVDEESIMGHKRGKGFKDLIIRLSKLFVDKEQLCKSLCIVFNKIRNIHVEDYKEAISEWFLKNKDLGIVEKDLLHDILTKSAIAYFEAPTASGAISDEQKDKIFSQLDHAQYIDKPDVKITISTSSLIAVNELFKKLDQKNEELTREIADEVKNSINLGMGLEKLNNLISEIVKLSTCATPLEAINAMEKMGKTLDADLSKEAWLCINNNITTLKKYLSYFESFFTKILPDVKINMVNFKESFGSIGFQASILVNQIENKDNKEKLKANQEKFEKMEGEWKFKLDQIKNDNKVNQAAHDAKILALTEELEKAKQNSINMGDMNNLFKEQQAMFESFMKTSKEQDAKYSETITAMMNSFMEHNQQIIEKLGEPSVVHNHYDSSDDGWCTIF